jgi:hypothetical protein
MSDTRTETTLAKVVHVADQHAASEVVINRGARHGVKLGDRFLVFGYGPDVVDPDTGEDLGKVELVRGRGEVVHVQDRLSTLRSMERRRRIGGGKRIIRDSGVFGFGVPSGKVIEEDISPEESVPFEAIRLGDVAKPI